MAWSRTEIYDAEKAEALADHLAAKAKELRLLAMELRKGNRSFPVLHGVGVRDFFATKFEAFLADIRRKLVHYRRRS
jgi:hypothetical protein